MFRYCALVVVLFFSLSMLAADSVETVSTPPPVVESLKNAVAATGYRAVSGGKAIAEVWPAKEVKGEKSGGEGALYPEIPKGAFAGVVRLPNGGGDFRGQKIAAGVYTMRYALLPADGNHIGVAPGPDFVLLVAVDSDTSPETAVPYPRLVKMSAKSAGTNHPAAFSLDPPAKESPSVTQNEAKQTVLTFDVTVNGARIPVGLILIGTGQ